MVIQMQHRYHGESFHCIVESLLLSLEIILLYKEKNTDVDDVGYSVWLRNREAPLAVPLENEGDK
jgi:hypothetical protein